MKRWLLLAALLIASPAHALIGSTGRLAVIYEGHPLDTGGGWATNANYAATLGPLLRGGAPVDFYNASYRNWGEPGVDDSTWFRERYDAILIPHQTGRASGWPVESSMWSTNFQNAAGQSGMSRSPVGGRWWIPVFELCPNRIYPTTTSYDDSTGNNYNTGGTIASPAGSFGTPAVSTGGTWRYRFLYRWRDSEVDTLYAQSKIFVCLDAPWPGPGSVAAIAWADTFPFGSCSASDTAAVAWRYRARDDLPGIYRFGFDTGTLSNAGVLMALQYIYTLTPITPRERINTPLMEHNPETAAVTNRTYEARAQAVHNTLRNHGIRWNLAVRTDPSGFKSLYDNDALARIRASIAAGCVWHPFSSNAGWTTEFYSASDTAGFRVRWNQLMRTATHADSFALPPSRLSRRMVTAAGLVGVWLTGTLKDSGFDTIESTLSTPNPAGWSLQTAPNDGPSTFGIPGDPLGRTVRVEKAFGLPHDTSFVALRGAQDPYGYIGLTWMQAFWRASQIPSSLYWHGGGSVGVYRMDPYYAWLMDILARHFRYFDKVVRTEPE